MAANPSVCAVCLTRDRPEMLRRAVRCFDDQTYKPRLLSIEQTETFSHLTIGELRNMANAIVSDDIILHWDDDDWSHPNRIAEQVALLQASGADAVGYSQMLFWDSRIVARTTSEARVTPDGLEVDIRGVNGEAWLYRNASPNYAIGTSLCYWRETWKRKPFPPLPRVVNGKVVANEAEDDTWIKGLEVACEGSLRIDGPRMIASIHGGNAMPYNIERWHEAKRVVEWDDYCRKVMAL